MRVSISTISDCVPNVPLMANCVGEKKALKPVALPPNVVISHNAICPEEQDRLKKPLGYFSDQNGPPQKTSLIKGLQPPHPSLADQCQQSLKRNHDKDREAIAVKFVGTQNEIEPSKRVLIYGGISFEIAAFVADYLGIPTDKENLIHIRSKHFNKRKRVQEALEDAIGSIERERVRGGSLTFVGHMSQGDDKSYRFEHMSSKQLVELIGDMQPHYLGMVSCSSEPYVKEVIQHFAAQEEQYFVPRWAAFQDEVEVSPYPKDPSKYHLKAFLYAGPEISDSCPAFSSSQHKPLLNVLRFSDEKKASTLL